MSLLLNKVGGILVLLFWVCLLVVWIMVMHGRSEFRKGYEQGVYQTMVYNRCTEKYPSLAFRADMWNLVNLPDDCRYIEAERRKVGELP